MYALIQRAADDGLQLSDILADIPHDAGAVLVYVLMGLFCFFMWYANRAR